MKNIVGGNDKVLILIRFNNKRYIWFWKKKEKSVT